MTDERRFGQLRRICLVCGREIHPYPQVASGAAIPIVTERYGVRLDSGFAHAVCHRGSAPCDLTGQPDYRSYNTDSALPAYSPSYDSIEAGERADAQARRYREMHPDLNAESGHNPRTRMKENG